MNRFLLGVTLRGMSGEVWCDLAAPGITTLVQRAECISRPILLPAALLVVDPFI